MTIDTDKDRNITIRADGTAGTIILILKDGNVLEVEEKDGKIFERELGCPCSECACR